MFYFSDIKRPFFATRILVVLVSALAIPLAAHAQVLYGSVTGNVTDQKGDVVPGARVTATNVGTGTSKELITDDRGGYQFNNLQPGLYSVTIQATSFKRQVEENIRVEANS